LKLKVTLLPCLVTLFSTDHAALRSRPAFFFSSWKVNSTSSAVNGLPSVHFTPDRIVNVSVLFPLLHL